MIFIESIGSSPVLVSGSLDKTIVVWDLLERRKIRKLPLEHETGHADRINSVVVFDRTSENISPFIVSCG